MCENVSPRNYVYLNLRAFFKGMPKVVYTHLVI